jgi:7-carboxy-7-deazaguanine synthase (Cx14CxxC type)
MSYRIKEIFYTLQGEGTHTGRPAVFCRFSGCNLWSGREEDRHSAVCRFCDTDFVGVDGPGGGSYASPDQVVEAILARWPGGAAATSPFVVCTGGEPLLQLDASLVEALHARNIVIALETNGTLPVPAGIDWVCVSPKANAGLAVLAGDELKLVYPQNGLNPATFQHLEYGHFLLQPMDGPDRESNTRIAMEYCLEHPVWKLSLQVHKILGLP